MLEYIPESTEKTGIFTKKEWVILITVEKIQGGVLDFGDFISHPE